MATTTRTIDDTTTELVISHENGLRYTFTLHQTSKGPGISLSRSPILPLVDIPFIVQALQNIYASALETGLRSSK